MEQSIPTEKEVRNGRIIAVAVMALMVLAMAFIFYSAGLSPQH